MNSVAQPEPPLLVADIQTAAQRIADNCRVARWNRPCPRNCPGLTHCGLKGFLPAREAAAS